MNKKTKIAIIAASPKPPGKAASDFLADFAADTLRDAHTDVHVINARRALTQHSEREVFSVMAEADALIIIFPLYVFCLPGLTMRFLEQYSAYLAAQPERKTPAVYAVVNCGFPEPEINEEAARVVERFARAIGGRYGRGVLIGSGGMATLNVSPSRKMRDAFANALRKMKAEITTGSFSPDDSLNLRVNFPRKLYFFMGHMGWRRQIRSNGKKKADLYARPYQPAENT